MTAIPVRQICISRPVHDMPAMLSFYRDALGLPVLFQFGEEDVPAGVMIGLPGAGTHLEFLRVGSDENCAPPSEQSALVLHLGSEETARETAGSLVAHGFNVCTPANPYWLDKAVSFRDPAGWPVILSFGPGI